jgi:hypothetical protein
MNDLLVELFRHNTWANLKMIEFCRDLPPDQRDGDFKIPGTYGAIRETLHHMIGSQEGYLYTYGRSKEPPAEAFTTWDALVERARKSSEAYEVWTSETPVGQVLDADFGPQTWSAPTWLILPAAGPLHGTSHTSAPQWRTWASSLLLWISGSTVATSVASRLAPRPNGLESDCALWYDHTIMEDRAPPLLAVIRIISVLGMSIGIALGIFLALGFWWIPSLVAFLAAVPFFFLMRFMEKLALKD